MTQRMKTIALCGIFLGLGLAPTHADDAEVVGDYDLEVEEISKALRYYDTNAKGEQVHRNRTLQVSGPGLSLSLREDDKEASPALVEWITQGEEGMSLSDFSFGLGRAAALGSFGPYYLKIYYTQHKTVTPGFIGVLRGQKSKTTERRIILRANLDEDGQFEIKFPNGLVTKWRAVLTQPRATWRGSATIRSTPSGPELSMTFDNGAPTVTLRSIYRAAKLGLGPLVAPEGAENLDDLRERNWTFVSWGKRPSNTNIAGLKFSSAEFLNLRAGAGPQHPVVAIARRGEAYHAGEFSRPSRWTQFSLPDGRKVYAFKRHTHQLPIGRPRPEHLFVNGKAKLSRTTNSLNGLYVPVRQATVWLPRCVVRLTPTAETVRQQPATLPPGPIASR